MKNTANLLRVLGVFAIIIIFFTVLTGCDTSDDPKPTPPPVIPTVSITTATALPSSTTFGGKSKITIVAKNATSVDVMEGEKVIKKGEPGQTEFEFETDNLFKTTTYTVVAKNNNQSKTADLTIIVGEIPPKLKLFLEGKWQLVKEEKMKKWNGETSYTEVMVNPCEADDVYNFPTPTTCTAVWGPNSCAPDVEKLSNKAYFGGFDTQKMKLLWILNEEYPWDVLEITETKLRIHTLFPRLDDFTILTDVIREFKNVK